ncbi:MAG: RNA polymerase sigma factor [Thiotrichaceae bacterium]
MLLDKQQLDQLYRYCYALCVHRDDAYDLLQSSLEKYLKRPANSQQSELPYLRRIIRNQFIDNTRHGKVLEFQSLEESSEAIPMDLCDLDSIVINEELVDIVWSLLNTSEREIIFLWAIEGYTAAEIADEIDMPRGTVLSKIHRLRKKIIERFDENGQGNAYGEGIH